LGSSLGSMAAGAGSGMRLRNKPNAMGLSRGKREMRPASSHLGMKSWLTIA
jgi:hypothetical protein